MKLRHAAYLASRSIVQSPWRSLILTLGLAITMFLPAFTYLFGQMAEGELLRRAETTPLIVGRKGSAFDLTLSSVYFKGQSAETLHQGDVDALGDVEEVVAVPLFLEHTAASVPLVGTTLEYFDERRLSLAEGRMPVILGEIVIGAGVAASKELEVGSQLQSDLNNLYNISGSYPILLKVVGILSPSGTPDDQVMFTDLRTTWVLEGLMHGHNDLAAEQGGANTEVIEASPSLFLFQEITADNLSSFHLHGSPEQWPVSSVLVFPKTQRAFDILLGELALSERLQAVRPPVVVRDVLDIVLQIQALLARYWALIGLTTAAFFLVIIHLSWRLRSREIQLLKQLGASRGAIRLLLGSEIAALIVGGLALATAATFITLTFLSEAAGF